MSKAAERESAPSITGFFSPARAAYPSQVSHPACQAMESSCCAPVQLWPAAPSPARPGTKGHKGLERRRERAAEPGVRVCPPCCTTRHATSPGSKPREGRAWRQIQGCVLCGQDVAWCAWRGPGVRARCGDGVRGWAQGARARVCARQGGEACSWAQGAQACVCACAPRRSPRPHAGAAGGDRREGPPLLRAIVWRCSRMSAVKGSARGTAQREAVTQPAGVGLWVRPRAVGRVGVCRG